MESNLDPFLRNCSDSVPIIQVLAQRYRDGRIAPKGNPVRSGTVEDAVRAVGQAFTHLGGGGSHATADSTIPEDRRVITYIICIAFYFLL
jgi:hypothetical protein